MTTASLHQEMVQALENARDYPSGCDCMVDSWTAWERHDWDCVRYVAGVALDGWERREPLRDDEALERAVFLALFGGATDTQDFFEQATLAAMRTEVVRRVLDALEPLLFGERGWMGAFEDYQAKRDELQSHRAACRSCRPATAWPAGCPVGERLYQETRQALRASRAVCQVPPPGWVCSREAGHGGPCAASPAPSPPNTEQGRD